MRNVLVGGIVFLLALTCGAQRYGNEWINYSQQYFKFPVYKEGVYRIDSTTLSKYYNLNSTNPKNFQLYLKGKEQFLFIKGESDGLVNGGDYLEFYANSFMGEVDSLIYTNIKYVPNPYAPLFNDTIYAFLTLSNSLNNKRYVLETDTNTVAYPQADYFYAEAVHVQPVDYNFGATYLELGLVTDPHYTQEEGIGTPFQNGNSLITAFPPLLTYTASPTLPFYLTLNYAGNSKDNLIQPDHRIQLFHQDQNNAMVMLSDTIFSGFAPIRKSFALNPQTISPTSNFTLTSLSVPSFTGTNSTMLSFAKIFYPHTLNMNSQSKFNLTLNGSPGTKSFYNFFNLATGASTTILLFDLSAGKKINTVLNGQYIRAVVPGTGNSKYFITTETYTIPITSLVKVNETGYFNYFKKNVGNRPYILIYHPKLATSAIQYRDYRKTVQGGSFDVITATTSELYEQFGYGVNKHPISIRNFLKYLNDSLSQKPAYVFLIGKGINAREVGPSSQTVNLIPTMGSPSCDNLYPAELSVPNNGRQEIPIGRIAASTNKQVNDYLLKVQEHEGSGADDWKKRVLHFVGGDDETLSNRLSSYMQVYERTIKDTLFGAEVLTFKKNTTAPIQINISDSIRNIINNGAALINFFGHGSDQGFDQAIDDPGMYNNKGKYPFVIANSCFSGNIHLQDRTSVSENFVFASEKGSIGFLATTSFGYDNSLHDFTTGFYKALSVTRYNRGIGDVIKEATNQNALSTDKATTFVGLDMTLHGDPAIIISNGGLPDYEIRNSDISFDLTKNTDSLGMKIKLVNHQKAVHDSIYVKIERLFPNGDSLTIMKGIAAPYYRDSMQVNMAIDFDRGIGLNKFKVKIDFTNRVFESNETNNATIGTVDVFVPGGDVMPAYPFKYAIVRKSSTITLKASTTDPFAPYTTYRLQLDTNDLFLNPVTSTLISTKGGVLEWLVNLPFPDSTVFFWRVSRDSISPQKSFVWRQSSFQMIEGKRGWGQSHFNQFKNDNFQFVTYKKDLRKFVFENSRYSVGARSGIFPNLFLTSFNSFFNNYMLDAWSATFDGWNFAVFDSISGQPWKAIAINTPSPGSGIYNNCASQGGRNVFSFGPVSECGAQPWLQDMRNFLNALPPSNYVLGYTTGAFDPKYSQLSTYSNALYTAFESVGLGSIRSTPDTVAYIFFGRKGMIAGQARELIGKNKKEIIYLEDSIKTTWRDGYIASEVVGPSKKWNSLHWRVKPLETSAGDTTLLKLVGIKANGQLDTLQTFKEDSTDIYALSNYIDAGTYPFLKLVAFMRDNVHRSAPQLKRWQVLFEEAPECAINPLKGFASINDSLQEGDVVTFRFPIENIGVKNFEDSLVVTYWIEDNQRTKQLLPASLKARPFKAGQVIVDTVKINSYQLKGNNTLWIYVNPIQHPRYQYEQLQSNNIGRYAFTVHGDITNPLLDVTFDGVRILNGDIVSAKPNILITLKDENKFLALNDTSAFSVFLQTPNQSLQQRIYFAQGLQFTPAQLPKNSASITYQPVLQVDGKYTLMVQAKDRSRNASGASDYRVQFEINSKPSVTSVLNYPNPFSTSTRFVFTLTGSEIPEVFTIQIMTITGKIVREITRSELGYMHIGRNISEYAWDGRDNYGDRLANGVYLYRVITKLNGEDIEKNSTSADKFFVKEFGKMVLMR
ncbi:MAG: C25 family cysteine peptidase [bacterium]|nr:C25 family cysteine peptidase [bacterium]